LLACLKNCLTGGEQALLLLVYQDPAPQVLEVHCTELFMHFRFAAFWACSSTVPECVCGVVRSLAELSVCTDLCECTGSAV
jgi:hypothetical protein